MQNEKLNAKIAIPHSEGQIFPHMGRTTEFKIYTIENGKVTSAEVVDTEGTGHEDLALWLVWHAVNGVICGNIGPGMQGALAGAGIGFLAGVTGAADAAIEQLLAGTLVGTQAATCAGHGESGGCGGHDHAEGGCGGCGHGCGGCHHHG